MYNRRTLRFRHLFPTLAALAVVSVAHADVFVLTSTGVTKYYDDGTNSKVLFTASGQTTPRGITIGPDGTLFVCYSGSGNIVRYDGTTGAVLGTFIAKGTGTLQSPITARYNSTTKLWYVTDFGAQSPPQGGPFSGQVLCFNPDGTFKNAVIPAGNSTFPCIVSAYGLDFDGAGNINVSVPDGGLAFDQDGNSGYGCVLGYTVGGGFIDITANNPNDPSTNGFPADLAYRGISFSPDKSRLYTAIENASDGLGDGYVGAVGIYNLSYNLVAYMGFDSFINFPRSVAVGPVDNNLYVVSIGNGHVDVYSTIPPYGHMSTFASGLSGPSDIAFRQFRRIKAFDNPVTGGASTQGTAIITAPAGPGGLTVNLASSNTNIATVPATVTIPQGSQTATFPIQTTKQTANTSVTISGSYAHSTPSLLLNVITTALNSLTITPTTVAPGATATGTVTLSAAAPAGGYPVNLSSNSTVAIVPATVTVAAGSTSATFTITTTTATGTATISAEFGGNTSTATLTVGQATTLTGLTIAPTTVVGGATATGTVTLSAAAPAGGDTVNLSSNSAVATVPATVTVAAGSTSATFTITTTNANATATISAVFGGVTDTAMLTVNQTTLTKLAIAPTTLAGGQTATGTVTLSAAAPVGGYTVNLSSNNAVATVPATVTVPAGSKTAKFTVTTTAFSGANKVAKISVAFGSITKAVNLSVVETVLTKLTIAPTTVVGGATATGTVTLYAAAPAGGYTVNLSSNNAVATVPATVTVPAGSKTATFTVTTTAFSGANKVATISAKATGITKAAKLTVKP